MPTIKGFLSPEHEAAFVAARQAHCRGELTAPICGAKTRSGGACRGTPIIGSGRCLRHAGPKAANERHQRLKEAYLKGQVPAAVWQRHVAKRARNKLRNAWKSNPWHPGSTIDLGAHHADFEVELRGRGLHIGAMPAAVVDWLAWRYQRFLVDRKSHQIWENVLTGDLPSKLSAAGAAPLDWVAPPQLSNPTDWKQNQNPVRTVASFKRSHPDRKRVPHIPDRTSGPKLRGRPRKMTNLTQDEAVFVQQVAYDNQRILSQLYVKCQSQRDRDLVLTTLVALARAPLDPARGRAWGEVVRCFN